MKSKIKNNRKLEKLIRDFSGHKPVIMGRMTFPKNPGRGYCIGQVLGIAYESKRDGVVEKYYHRFAKSNSRPLLVTTYDGKQLFLLGGAYNFTDRGIEDAS